MGSNRALPAISLSRAPRNPRLNPHFGVQSTVYRKQAGCRAATRSMHLRRSAKAQDSREKSDELWEVILRCNRRARRAVFHCLRRCFGNRNPFARRAIFKARGARKTPVFPRASSSPPHFNYHSSFSWHLDRDCAFRSGTRGAGANRTKAAIDPAMRD